MVYIYSGSQARLLFLFSRLILWRTMPSNSLGTQRTAMQCFQPQRLAKDAFTVSFPFATIWSKIFWLVTEHRSSQKGRTTLDLVHLSSLHILFPSQLDRSAKAQKEAEPWFICQKQSSSRRFVHSCCACPNPFPEQPCYRGLAPGPLSNPSDTGLMLISPQTILGQSSLPGWRVNRIGLHTGQLQLLRLESAKRGPFSCLPRWG